MKWNWRQAAAFGLLISSFLVVILYVYAYLALVNYLGFAYDGPTGLISQVQIDTSLLQDEDRIEQVNGIPWKDYAADRSRPNFAEYQTGDVIPLVIRRGDQSIPVSWPIAGPRAWLVAGRLFGTLPIGPLFWGFGLVAYWVIRPRDTRWFLLVTLYTLIAAWIVAGTCSPHRVWYSSILVRALTWPLVAVLLHYHWIFPRPFSAIPRRWLIGGYGLVGLLMLAEIVQIPPRSAYGLAAVVGLVGSAGMLIAHAARQPDSRRDLRVLAAMFLLLIATVFNLSWLGRVLHQQNLFALTLIFLPLLPLAYLYLAYRRQMGGMETRPNRLLGFLAYAQGIGILATLILGLIAWLTAGPSAGSNADLVAGSTFILFLGLGGTIVYPNFQRWFERRILGLALPPDEVVAAYARQIAASPDRDHLRAALEQEIFPSLMIRQAAVWYFPEADGRGAARRAEPVIRLGVSETQLPAPDTLSVLPPNLNAPGGEPLPGFGPLAPDWVRLALPLEYRGHPIGLALFGRRDPDDEYTAELPILRTLLAQTALAVVNTDQAALLHALQRHEIERQEAERVRLAHDLHDEVLGQLSVMSHHVEGDNPAFWSAYEAGVARLRAILGGLRPVTLEKLGLYSALQELADDLDQRIAQMDGRGPQLCFDLVESADRYPAEVELAVYRIMQQASLNALEHAQSVHLTIRGELTRHTIDLCVKDDGQGFEVQPGELIPMLVRGHYGMLTMHERAAQVGARLTVDSAPGQGVQVCVAWKEIR